MKINMAANMTTAAVVIIENKETNRNETMLHIMG